MRLAIPIKLSPTVAQADMLKRTLTQANAAADWLAAIAYERKVYRAYSLHHIGYYDMREQFGLSAQVTVRVIAKVADSYRANRRSMHRFRSTGAISYDSRILRFTENAVSIWTVDGRQTIPFDCGERQRLLLQRRSGESRLELRDGNYYLAASADVPEPGTYTPTEWLGVDLGIVQIATDSDGCAHAGAHLNGLRRRHRRQRGRLQAKGTRSAKRLLQRRSRKEARMARDVNHCISKSIVAEAERTGRGIALEDLKGIRNRIRARRHQRATLHSWAFAQLGSFIDYKAALAGVPVVYVDPRNTSRTCPACGHVDKGNRPSQATFKCLGCGFAGPADHIAAINIGGRAATSRPNGSEGCATHRQSSRSKLSA